MANGSPASDSSGAMATMNAHMDKLYTALTSAMQAHGAMKGAMADRREGAAGSVAPDIHGAAGDLGAK